MQTFYRNYDAALGRWTGVDPKAEAADSWTTYQYAYNNPGMLNDPMGDVVDINRLAYAQWQAEQRDNPDAKIARWEAMSADLTNSMARLESDMPYYYTPHFDFAGGILGGGYYITGADNIAAALGQIKSGRGVDFTIKNNKFNYSVGGVDYDGEGNPVGTHVFGKTASFSSFEVANPGGPGPQYPRGAVGGPVPWYGSFLGPGPDGNPYTLKGYNGKTLRPIDMLDQAAQRHDYAYYKSHTGGVNGTLFNKSVRDADLALSAGAQWV